ncbi:MAG: transglycosylase domain-containing protein [Lachnospiraceae bacterium]|nr:transglycosylase domain-containing protein [Lachnospiraceae bacterium]
MNFGRDGVAAAKRKLHNPAPAVGRIFTVGLGMVIIVAVIALLLGGISSVYGMMKGILDAAPNIDDIDATPTGYLSTVLDAEGNVTASLVASGANRIYVTLDEIPEDLQHAFVAIEDERFYQHKGIDPKGIIRAAVVGLRTRDFSQGASTITQQLLKNNVFVGWTSEGSLAERLERKIQEQYLALQLEKKQSKEWILENYLNTINLGQNTLGVQAASERYFGKDVSELTLSECAVIAAITQNPSGYNPIRHPEDNRKRAETCLNKMLELGFIDEEEYQAAWEDDVYSRIQVVNIENSSKEITSYFVDSLTDQVIDDLIEVKGYTEAEAYKALYQGGLTIYSTQDPHLQAICDEEANNPENYGGSDTKNSFSYRLTIQHPDGTYDNYSDQTMLSYYKKATGNHNFGIDYASEEEAAAAIEQYKSEIMVPGDEIIGESVTYTLEPQVSMSLIEQSTGEVKAIVGGRGDKSASKTLNRATGTTRQPGSTFKVLAAYAPAMDIGAFTLGSVQDDAPYHYSNTNHTQVNNYDHSYRGYTTVREAITRSINVVAVKTLTDIGTETGYNKLHDFGFTTLVEQDNTQALALGGITNGVKNLELTAAYASIANGGVYIRPRFYTKILDHKGNILIDNTPQTREVLKKTTAWLLTDAMKDVMNGAGGTGAPAYFGDTMAQAGKSGTTSNNRDALWAGFTPYYTCVVWGGYDDNTVLNYTTYPKLVWKAAMSRIHEGLEYKDFEKPEGIVEASVCIKSGLRPVGGLCEHDPRGSMVRTEYFADGTIPTSSCNHHVSAIRCAESGALASVACPEELRTASVYQVGGHPGTADDGVRLSAETLAGCCPIHPGGRLSNIPNLSELITVAQQTRSDDATTGVLKDGGYSYVIEESEEDAAAAEEIAAAQAAEQAAIAAAQQAAAEQAAAAQQAEMDAAQQAAAEAAWRAEHGL